MPETFEVGASVDVWAGIVNLQIYDEDAGVSVKPPRKFTEDDDPYLRVHLHAENDWPDEPHDGEASASFSLTREQARALGAYLVEHADDDAEIVMDTYDP